jgi:long-chain acyl-CoA synthetase
LNTLSRAGRAAVPLNLSQQLMLFGAVGLGSLTVYLASLGFILGEKSDIVDVPLTVPVGDASKVPSSGWLPRRNGRQPERLSTKIEGTSASTIHEAFREAAGKFAESPCMGQRTVIKAFSESESYTTEEGEKKTRMVSRFELGAYEWETFRQIDAQMDQVAHGLVRVGLAPRERVMLFAETAKAWQLCLHGSLRANCVVSTAYATLGLDALAYSIELTESTTLFADRTLLSKLVSIRDGSAIDGKAVSTSCLKRVIVIDNLFSRIPEEVKAVPTAIAALAARPASKGGPIEVIDLTTVIAKGTGIKSRATLEAADRTARTTDDAVIMFTSGSTGTPKGVRVLHKNLLAAMAGMDSGCPELGPRDTLIGYLPLAHILALAAEHVVFCKGGRVGYGTPKTLTSTMPAVKNLCRGDVVELEPSIMAGVPEIYNRILAGVQNNVAAKGAVVKAMFQMGVKAKLDAIEKRGLAGIHHTFWDALVFDKVRTMAVGGNLRMFISGGGPLPPDTQRFVQAVFCCPIQQGYGLTETCGGATVGWGDSPLVNNAGVVINSAELKLIPWEEAGYSPSNDPPTGEVCISGDNVTAGYFGAEDKTREVFIKEKDGKVWFHTGDIGRWAADGTLEIIDRKKDLVKFSGGEYVSFGKVESALKTIDILAQQCLVGDSTRQAPMLLAVVDPVAVAAKLPDAASMSREEMTASDAVKAFVVSAVKKRAKERGLHKFETPLSVILCPEEWTPESGLLTAALKLRRNVISEHFAGVVNAEYKKFA